MSFVSAVLRRRRTAAVRCDRWRCARAGAAVPAGLVAWSSLRGRAVAAACPCRGRRSREAASARGPLAAVAAAAVIASSWRPRHPRQTPVTTAAMLSATRRRVGTSGSLPERAAGACGSTGSRSGPGRRADRSAGRCAGLGARGGSRGGGGRDELGDHLQPLAGDAVVVGAHRPRGGEPGDGDDASLPEAGARSLYRSGRLHGGQRYQGARTPARRLRGYPERSCRSRCPAASAP